MSIATKRTSIRLARSRLRPGQTCFIIAEIVSVLAKDEELEEAVVVRIPVRWHRLGFKQDTIPIEAIALP
jgi:hypothetical protein